MSYKKPTCVKVEGEDKDDVVLASTAAFVVVLIVAVLWPTPAH